MTPATHKLHWSKEFVRERSYLRALKRFVDLTKFGVMASAGNPVHVNGKRNPRPRRVPGKNFCLPEKLSLKQCRRHLTGESKQDALFIVNRPTSDVHELTFDIDALKEGQPNPWPIVDWIVANVLPEGAVPFLEPSRNGKGAYVRILLRRRSEPAEFNRLMLSVAAAVRAQMNKEWTITHHAALDNIKGTVWYRYPNPAYDECRAALPGKEEWTTIGGDYQYSKYREGFNYDDSLEPSVYSRGVLITAPCFGCFRSDPSRLDRYLDWAEEGAMQPIDEEWFEQWLASNQLNAAQPTSVEEPSEDPAAEPSEINEVGQSKPETRHTAYQDLRETGDAFIRAWELVRRLKQRLGRSVTHEEAWVAYHEQNLHTGRSDDDLARRRKRLEWVVQHIGQFDEIDTKGQSFGRHRDSLLALINQFVTPTQIAAAGCRYKIDSLDLALHLYCIQWNVLKVNPMPSHQYSVPNDSFEGLYKVLRQAGELPRSRKTNRHKTVACKKILEAAGLVETLDGKYMTTAFARKLYGPKAVGCGKKYSLGVNHPLYVEFQHLLAYQPPISHRKANPAPKPVSLLL